MNQNPFWRVVIAPPADLILGFVVGVLVGDATDSWELGITATIFLVALLSAITAAWEEIVDELRRHRAVDDDD